MKLETGKNHLRDIHNFMTKVNMVRFESRNRFVESRNFERFLRVESGIDEVKAEIDTYRNNIRLAKEYMDNFEILKATYLKKLQK